MPSREPGPFSVPAFRLLWLNQITFFFVANALRFVYGWVVLDGLNRDESTQGLVVFALGVPSLFLMLPAGVWADRVDRRRLLMATQAVLALVMGITAFTLGDGAGSVPILIASALAAGIATSIGVPVRQSLVPELLPKDLLLGGIALGALAMTASMIAGPVSAQLVGNRAGFNGAFWYLLVLLVLGVAFLARMRVPSRLGESDADAGGDDPKAKSTPPTMREATVEGLQFVWRDPALRVLFILLAVAGLIMSALMFVLVQAMVKEEFGRNSGDAAPLFALMGIGIAITSVFVMRRGDMPRKGTLFMRAMLGGTTTLFVMGRAQTYWQLAVLSLILGMCGGIFINMNQGLVQRTAPPELMGRVMGLYAMVSAGLTPVGALGLGAIASVVGTANTISGGALVGFLIVAVSYWRATELHAMQ